MKMVWAALATMAPAVAWGQAQVARSARAVLARQCEAIAKDDGPGFRATFTKDALALFPDGAVIGVGPDAIGKAMHHQYSDQLGGTDRCAPARVVVGANEKAAWVTADLQVSGPMATGNQGTRWSETHRLTELVVKDGDGWRVAAAHLSSPRANRVALADNRKQSEVLPEIPVGDEKERLPFVEWLTAPGALLEHLDEDDAVSVLGSDAGERAVGPVAGQKLLKRWAGVRFQVVGTPRAAVAGEAATLAANVTATWKSKQGPVTVPYRLLLIASRRTDGSWSLVSIHFSNG